MNTHYCKVGTVRPNLNKVENSMENENNSIETKTNKTSPFVKLSK